MRVASPRSHAQAGQDRKRPSVPLRLLRALMCDRHPAPRNAAHPPSPAASPTTRWTPLGGIVGQERERERLSQLRVLCVSLSNARLWAAARFDESVLRLQVSRQAPTKRHTRIRDPSVLTRNTRAAHDTRVQRASRGAQYPPDSSSPPSVAGPRALERVRSPLSASELTHVSTGRGPLVHAMLTRTLPCRRRRVALKEHAGAT